MHTHTRDMFLVCIDALSVYQVDVDGTRTQVSANGNKVVAFGGSKYTSFPSGQQIFAYPDGTRKQVNADGSMIVVSPNGSQSSQYWRKPSALPRRFALLKERHRAIKAKKRLARKLRKKKAQQAEQKAAMEMARKLRESALEQSGQVGQLNDADASASAEPATITNTVAESAPTPTDTVTAPAPTPTDAATEPAANTTDTVTEPAAVSTSTEAQPAATFPPSPVIIPDNDETGVQPTSNLGEESERDELSQAQKAMASYMDAIQSMWYDESDSNDEEDSDSNEPMEQLESDEELFLRDKSATEEADQIVTENTSSTDDSSDEVMTEFAAAVALDAALAPLDGASDALSLDNSVGAVTENSSSSDEETPMKEITGDVSVSSEEENSIEKEIDGEMVGELVLEEELTVGQVLVDKGMAEDKPTLEGDTEQIAAEPAAVPSETPVADATTEEVVADAVPAERETTELTNEHTAKVALEVTPAHEASGEETIEAPASAEEVAKTAVQSGSEDPAQIELIDSESNEPVADEEPTKAAPTETTTTEMTTKKAGDVEVKNTAGEENETETETEAEAEAAVPPKQPVPEEKTIVPTVTLETLSSTDPAMTQALYLIANTEIHGSGGIKFENDLDLKLNPTEYLSVMPSKLPEQIIRGQLMYKALYALTHAVLRQKEQADKQVNALRKRVRVYERERQIISQITSSQQLLATRFNDEEDLDILEDV